LRGERVTRLRAIAEKMAADGLPIDPDAVLASAGAAAGRPHLGRALIDAGYVSDMNAAFAGPLATSGKYYVEKVDTPLEAAVQMIAAAGGVSVLAHARARARGRILDLDQVRELVPLGLGGVEVHHMDHSPEDTAVMADLAAELDLIVTGSSDYHGTNKTVKLGEYITAPEQYDRLVAAARP
ncbi:MAG: phosphatase, partial [Rhodococcus sp. (in: high G+C Gram-positive bacteria)]